MRFHVVSLPHTNTTLDFSACAYTEKVRKFCVMMQGLLGHEVFLYAGQITKRRATNSLRAFRKTNAQRRWAMGTTATRSSM